MGRLDIDKLLDELNAPESEPAPDSFMDEPRAEELRARTASNAAAHDEIGDEAESVVDSGVLSQRTNRTPDQHSTARVSRAANSGLDGTIMIEVYNPEMSDEGVQSVEKRIREAAIEHGVLSAKDLTIVDTLLRQSPGRRLCDVMVGQGADEEKLLRLVAHCTGQTFERVTIPEDGVPDFDIRMAQRLGLEYCKSSRVLPLRMERGRLVVATSRPEDIFTLDDIRLRLNASSIKPVLVPSLDIFNAVEALGGDVEGDADVEAILSDIDEDDVRIEASNDQEVDLEREAAESPVIRYVNYIIQSAVNEGASDIHIEPGDKSLKVRFRIDGLLFESMQPPARMAAAITSRLKIMANLDISERRVPQDGRIRCQVQGRKLDLRMSTLPSSYGEKTVMRILDTRSINVDLENLGFDESTLTIWSHQIEQPHGIVLVTGPTGSGKTTTLYASLRKMDKKSKNVSTVEDPIEYHLDGITQTQTHEKIGMTFARALKALLRQDPDVIMVGEIRDQETAHTAIQAALTGHLVLSTLHTNDAPSSITRLVNIGIEPFLIGAAVNASLAQRLVRRTCKHCRAEQEITDELREFMTMQGITVDQVWHGAGCERCRNTGYSGRLGIYELLVVDDHLRDIIARNPNVTEFRRLCCERGMVTLRQDGIAKVQQGSTTIQEVLRVTESAM